MQRLILLLAATALSACGPAAAAPIAFIQSWSPNQLVSAGQGASHTVDLNAWARQALGSDRFQVLSGRLRLGFSDDADALVDRGLLGYDGQTTSNSAYRGVRDGRSGVITERRITDWQSRGFEDEAEQALVTGNGLRAVASSGSRQSAQDGPVRETGRDWSGWTCYWWGCSGTETVRYVGERHRITRYDGDFSLDLVLGRAVLDDFSQDGRWAFGVGAQLGDFLWRHARLDLEVVALPPSQAVPAPPALALTLAALGLAWRARRPGPARS